MPPRRHPGRLVLVINNNDERSRTVARSGDSIYNEVTKEYITFLRTTEETGGDLLEFECRVAPDGIPLPPHVHETQEERFEVISGTLGVMLGGTKHELRAGDRAVLPARVKHQWWNAGDTDVVFRVEAEPARNLEAVLEANAGMAAAGKLSAKRAMPRNPFLLADMGRLGETYLPVVPIWAQKIGLTMAATLGRAFGIDPTLNAYREAYRTYAAQTAVESAEAA
jgi:quercetin dioxygenase-like cupin family protein